MPGRWAGGRGSAGCPLKGTMIEAEVHDDAGKQQGVIFIYVKRLYSPGEAGRSLLADYVAASDEFYRYWVTTSAGAVTTVDGLYHLCRGNPTTCTGGTRNAMVVHLGKWRVWEDEELRDGLPNEYPKETKSQLVRYLKATRAEDGDQAGQLPWKESKESAGRRRGREEDEEERVEKSRKLTRLREDLAKLKDEVAREQGSAPGRRASDKAGGSGDRQPKKPKAFEGSLLPKQKKEDSLPGEGPCDRDDSEDDGSDENSDDAEDVTGGGANRQIAKDKERKKKKGDKRKKKANMKGTKARKPGGPRKDRGPFGLAAAEAWSSSGGSDEDRPAKEDDSESEGSVFRKAPPGMTQQLRLVRYAQMKPGRLAARLLRKMDAVTRFSAGAIKAAKDKQVPVSAHMYFLAVMTPNMKDRWTPRTQRELKTLTCVLDMLAAGLVPQAADVIGQRVKALEKSVQDNNQWRRAKFLELVEMDEVLLADRGEEAMMMKELENEEKLRGKGGWTEWTPWKGKGQGKEDRRYKGDGKDKGKTNRRLPAEQAAAKNMDRPE